MFKALRQRKRRSTSNESASCQCHMVDLPPPNEVAEDQRTRLPVEAEPRKGFSFWEIIRPNIGRDFSRIAVPVSFNEPLSLLQRLAESYTAYANLLVVAAGKKDAIERMELISAYAVSGLSTNNNRITKPFNPLLLETFESEKDDIRFVAEQVSHHPPVSAFHLEGAGFELAGSVSPQVSFGFNKLICSPTGHIELTLTDVAETYTWDTTDCILHNIMFGKPFMNIDGVATILCSASDITATLSYGGWTGCKQTDYHVDGYISRGGSQVRAIYGNWAQFAASCEPNALRDNYDAFQQLLIEHSDEPDKSPLIEHSNLLWVAHRLPPRFERMYHFTYLALSLNELTPELRAQLPPTDSRFRLDMLRLEEGRHEDAEEAKAVLETEQRARRHAGNPGEPKWFTLNAENGRWTWTGAYWEREFDACLRPFDGAGGRRLSQE